MIFSAAEREFIKKKITELLLFIIKVDNEILLKNVYFTSCTLYLLFMKQSVYSCIKSALGTKNHDRDIPVWLN